MDSEEIQPRIDIAVIHANIKALENAIQHQAIEYERRLTELNHAHAQGLEDKSKFLTIAVFDARMNAMDKEDKDAMAWRISIDVWRSRQAGVMLGVATVAGLVSGVVSAVAALWALSK